jgi:hypothetical protein
MPQIGRIVVIGLLVAGLVACEPSTSIPSGAQQVHVTATTSGVSLEPATVRPGDVYLVLDVPAAGVGFVQTQAAADASPGPLSATDLARLTQGDLQGFAIESLSVNCCGKVVKKTLAAGKYAIVGGGTQDGTSPSALAVLEVTP